MNAVLPLSRWLADYADISSLDLAIGFPRLDFLLSLIPEEGQDFVALPRLLCAPPGDGIAPPAEAMDGFTLRRELRGESRAAWRQRLFDLLKLELDSSPQTDETQRLLLRLASILGARGLHFRFWDKALSFSRAMIVGLGDQIRSLTAAGGFSPAALTGIDELRSLQSGENAREVARWFDERWQEATPISGEIEQLVLESWACKVLSPRDAYYKALIEYFSGSLELEDRSEDLNPMLERMADFQKDAYFHAKGILRRFGGVFISDVVGLGKTFIGLALLSYLVREQQARALVIAPPRLCGMWESLLERFEIDARVLASSMLKELPQYTSRDVVLIDESHNFRNALTRRYESVATYLRPEGQAATRRVILLTATPQNNRCWDVFHQLRLFPDTFAQMPIPGESLKEFFRAVEAENAELSSLLQHVVVRRTRSFVKREYRGATLPVVDKDGNMTLKEIIFPERRDGPDTVLRYSIEAVYGGLYNEIIQTILGLTYARYGLAEYLLPSAIGQERFNNLKRGGRALRGLFKALLLKRLESSLAAFRRTLSWIVLTHRGCLEGIKLRGVVPVNPRYQADDVDELDVEDALELFQGDFATSDFDATRLERDIAHDLNLLTSLQERLEQIPVAHDAKLNALLEHLKKHPPHQHKTLIFTQFSATATYLYDNLRFLGYRLEVITGNRGNQLDVLTRFSPRSMEAKVPPDRQLDLLISTDILSEGVNLQDADTILNYDLHWNPVRLIQRAGRIDRIGSQNGTIHIFNFLPERALEQALGLESVLRRRIAEILKVFGEDSAILPLDYGAPTEQAVIDAYTGKALKDAEEDRSLDGLSLHLEEVFRLRRSDPAQYRSLQTLRPAQRALLAEEGTQYIVMCQAGWFKRFYQRNNDLMTPMDDREALDELYLWAHATRWIERAKIHSGLNQATRTSFAHFQNAVLNLRDQRQQPRLTPAEDYVRSRLIELLERVSPLAGPEIERMIDWIQQGRHKAPFEPAARRWKREQLSAESIQHEMRGWLRQYTLSEEALPEPSVVVSVLGE